MGNEPADQGCREAARPPTRRGARRPRLDGALGLAHILDALAYWRSQIEGRPVAEVSTDKPPDAAAMRAAAESEHAALRALVSARAAGGFDGTISPRAGSPMRSTHDALVHALTHAAHHRGELAALLTALGASPGDLDYMDFLTEQPGSPA